MSQATPPRHELIAAELRRRIAGGGLPIGASLSSEGRLCEEFAVSRGTVRQALGALRSEGLIGGGPGKPPVVRARPIAQPFETFLSFSAWARDLGREPGQRTLEIARRPAREEAADGLGLDVGTAVVQILRLRLLDGRPAMLERTSFVEPVGRLLFDFDCDSSSIFEHLSSRGVDLAVGRHTFDAVGAEPVDAELLGVPEGSPLLRERRRTTSVTGEPLEWSDDRYRPELVTFTIENAQARPALARMAAA